MLFAEMVTRYRWEGKHMRLAHTFIGAIYMPTIDTILHWFAHALVYPCLFCVQYGLNFAFTQLLRADLFLLFFITRAMSLTNAQLSGDHIIGSAQLSGAVSLAGIAYVKGLAAYFTVINQQ
jgi:hypothetical protein